MNEYTRLFLHFLHALGETRRVSTFLFGTRLTNVTRAMHARDPDDALARCSAMAVDWSGGTRIGEALHRFNRDWSRRVLGQGAITLLITDGLERDDLDKLGAEMERLAKSSRRVIWVNPLLRYGDFAAKAGGIRTMLPYVDSFRPIHNLASMADLCQALSGRRGLVRQSKGAAPGGGLISRYSLAERPGQTHSSESALCGAGISIRQACCERRDAKAGFVAFRTKGDVSMLTRDEDVLAAAESWREAGRDVAIATVVETWGSAPRPIGSHLVIDAEGNFLGSVSGGCVEGAVVEEAADVIANGSPRMLEFGVADETAWRVGLSCGGRIKVYVEKLA